MAYYRINDLEDFSSETSQARFKLVDGMLSVDVKPDAIVDSTFVERIERFRKEMTKGLELPVLIYIPSNYLILDKEAFAAFGSESGMDGCLAKAVVISAPLRVLLLNFSLGFYRGKRPFRLFSSKSEAKMWLFSHVNVDELMAEQ
jgi:hypothetical protein